jgi:hypothetical protein
LELTAGPMAGLICHENFKMLNAEPVIDAQNAARLP